ncbi:MAG: lipopolysaccharide export system protein LptA [Verrucomicrobiales bacterium]|jgi:lipopolysaccharide export system protein LptA
MIKVVYLSGIFCSALVFLPVQAQAQAPKKPKEAPVPQPDSRPVASVKKKEAKSDIIIECEGQAYFNNKEQIVVFQQDVVVNHPGFHIECEELEVFLKGNPSSVLSDAPAEKGKAGASSTTLGTGASDTGDASDSVEKIFARGNGRLVALTKFSVDKAKEIRAKCGWVSYDSTSGDIILHDWPVLNQGNVSVQSTAKDTIIYVRQNGDFEASGPAIFQRNKD